jgi:hypothetical protein
MRKHLPGAEPAIVRASDNLEDVKELMVKAAALMLEQCDTLAKVRGVDMKAMRAEIVAVQDQLRGGALN